MKTHLKQEYFSVSESKSVKRIGFIGAGQMAQALASGIARTHADLEFLISDPVSSARDSFIAQVGEARVQSAVSNRDVFRDCDTVFLAVKPQYAAEALNEVVASGNTSPPLVVSVMAGIPIDRIAELTQSQRVIRVMPNTPCLIGQGACAMAVSPSVAAQDADSIEGYLKSVGTVVRVEEPLIDSVTGLSGSGPAYVFAFIESLVRGATKMGMPVSIAETLAVQTVLGAASMVKETGEAPAVLRDRVTSPGGTTVAGLKALQDGGFGDAVVSAVEKATQRSVELGNPT